MPYNPYNPSSAMGSAFRAAQRESQFPNYQGTDVVGWFNQKNAPQIPQNPYLGDWGSLIKQLQATASGQGPSLAGNAYNQAHAQGLRDQRTMAAGGSAGAARQAGMNMTRMNTGLAQGYSNARLQEQLAAQQALAGTLAQAGNAWFQPQQANLQSQLGTQTQGQQLMNFLSQLASGVAPLVGGK
jgi:hypothetical protein